jgi:transcriptional regulator with XRE-family HTH domain
MGTRARKKPRHLAKKLLAIRQHLGLSQSQIAKRLGFRTSYARVSEYESGTREPNLMVLLRYSEIANVHMEALVNDRIDLDQFHFELEQ